MRQILHHLASILRRAPIAVFCCTLAVSSAQAAEINYTSDTKVIVQACVTHLAGKAPDASLAKAGFSVFMQNKRGTSYRKNAGGGLLPAYLMFSATQKRKDPTYRSCSFLISLPNRLFAEFQSPEFYDFMNALRTVMKAKGFKNGKAKSGLGQSVETWTAGGVTYSMTFSGQSPVIALYIMPL